MEPARHHPWPGVSDPERLLVECCAAATPAVVSFRDGRAALRAAFSGFHDQRLELQLTDGPPGPLDGESLCHVSFLHHDRPMVFTAPLHGAERDGGRILLRLGVPACISSEGARSAFRVPARRDDPPAVAVVGDDGVTWPAELVNLSLTGMLVRFAGERPTLLPDQVVELSIASGEERVRLAGVVRRVEDAGVAFFFSDALSGDPGESAVRRLVASLERDWHSRIR